MTFTKQFKTGLNTCLESFKLLWKNKTVFAYLGGTILIHIVLFIISTSSFFGVRTKMALFFLMQKIDQLIVPCAAVAVAYHVAQMLQKKKVGIINTLKGIVPKLERIIFIVVIFEILIELTIIIIGNNVASIFASAFSIILPLIATIIATTDHLFTKVITDVPIMIKQKFGQLIGAAISLLATFYIFDLLLYKLFKVSFKYLSSNDFVLVMQTSLANTIEAIVMTVGIIVVVILFKPGKQK